MFPSGERSVREGESQYVDAGKNRAPGIVDTYREQGEAEEWVLLNKKMMLERPPITFGLPGHCVLTVDGHKCLVHWS